MVTPNIYDDLYLEPHQAYSLFGLFNTFSDKERRYFFQPISTIVHIMNAHICQRLRYFLSNNRALSLKLGDEDIDDSENAQFTERDTDIVTELSVLGQPSLWPLLKRCDLDLSVWQRSCNPFGTSQLIDAAFHGLHPEHLTIRLHRSMDGYWIPGHPWSRCFASLHAEHIEIID
jgi:hypothetical protein